MLMIKISFSVLNQFILSLSSLSNMMPIETVAGQHQMSVLTGAFSASSNISSVEGRFLYERSEARANQPPSYPSYKASERNERTLPLQF
ncbi:hypothetical protein JCM19053_3235 [Vibrio sp. JCM 19053]|nr:hypothetical protein JCM19053_3235 [Vibrio sp. JCM 19053]